MRSLIGCLDYGQTTLMWHPHSHPSPTSRVTVNHRLHWRQHRSLLTTLHQQVNKHWIHTTEGRVSLTNKTFFSFPVLIYHHKNVKSLNVSWCIKYTEWLFLFMSSRFFLFFSSLNILESVFWIEFQSNSSLFLSLVCYIMSVGMLFIDWQYHFEFCALCSPRPALSLSNISVYHNVEQLSGDCQI